MARRSDNRKVLSVFGGVDPVAVMLYMALMLVGLAAITSATWDEESANIFSFRHEYMKQVMWIGVAWVVGLVVLLLDVSIWHKLAYYLYGAGLVALVATLMFGATVNGATAWLRFGGVQIQTMEFAKIAIAIALARLMSEFYFSISKPGDLFKVAMLLLVPMGIAVLQNDTGSGLVLCSFLFVLYREGLNKWICLPIIFIAVLIILSFLITPTVLTMVLILFFTGSAIMMGVPAKAGVRYVAAVLLASTLLWSLLDALCKEGFLFSNALLICTVLSMAAVLVYGYRTKVRSLFVLVGIFFLSIAYLPTSSAVFNSVLKEHQRNRIETFLGVREDAAADYNVIQSKIAIGSGGFFGKGYLQGSQIRYGFVPEKHTDFIFCTIGEETGFVGCAVVLAIICALILRLMRMGDRQQDAFGRVYCYCVAAIFLFHTLVNVGMTIGLMPVMGIPLPFISYGGSSLVAFTIMIFIAFALDASTRKELPSYNRL